MLEEDRPPSPVVDTPDTHPQEEEEELEEMEMREDGGDAVAPDQGAELGRNGSPSTTPATPVGEEEEPSSCNNGDNSRSSSVERSPAPRDSRSPSPSSSRSQSPSP